MTVLSALAIRLISGNAGLKSNFKDREGSATFGRRCTKILDGIIPTIRGKGTLGGQLESITINVNEMSSGSEAGL